MTTHKHSVLLPDGRTATRNSKTHVYTHAVAVSMPAAERVRRLRADADAMLDTAESYRGNKSDRFPAEDLFTRWGVETVIGWAEGLEARALVAQTEAERIARAGEDEPWYIAGWCGRYDLAVKLEGTTVKRSGRIHTMILVTDVRS